MTQEEKELLLKDLSARLPYKVKVQIDFGEHCIKYGIDRYVDDTVICVWPETFEVGVNDEDQACDIEDVKPYLRPMSSMTEEEEAEYRKYVFCNPYLGEKHLESTLMCIDWLNEHHFDYRDLIEKGFAIEAPDRMYN